jgi:hypothetical protein
MLRINIELHLHTCGRSNIMECSYPSLKIPFAV